MQLLCPLTQAPHAGETQASCPLITSGPPPNPAPTPPGSLSSSFCSSLAGSWKDCLE